MRAAAQAWHFLKLRIFKKIIIITLVQIHKENHLKPMFLFPNTVKANLHCAFSSVLIWQQLKWKQ